MKKLLLLLLPFVIYGDSLKSLLDYAQRNNDIILSKSLSKESKAKEVSSVEGSYYPTVDVGAYYQRYDEANPIMPGTTYSGYATLSYNIYDGSKRSYTLKQKEDEFTASSYSYDATKKATTLELTQLFYKVKSLESKLLARKDASNAIKVQLERMRRFLAAELATSDDVARLEAAFAGVSYEIVSLEFEILTTLKSLELKVGKAITSLDKSSFTKEDVAVYTDLDAIKALKASKSSLLNASETIDSYYYPQIKIEDTYSFYAYDNEPSLGAFNIEQLDKQNRVMLSLNMRVLDFGVLGEQKEALRLSASALQSEINYKSKEQKMNQELSLQRIKAAKLNVESAKSGLKASSSALKTITEKYNNGIVDNVVYLDALTSQTVAKSTYEEALNNVELSYALYYFYNAKKLEEFLSE